jgi:hypothetical protein
MPFQIFYSEFSFLVPIEAACVCVCVCVCLRIILLQDAVDYKTYKQSILKNKIRARSIDGKIETAKTEVVTEGSASVSFCPIWAGLALKWGLRGEKPATNCLKAMSVHACVRECVCIYNVSVPEATRAWTE